MDEWLSDLKASFWKATQEICRREHPELYPLSNSEIESFWNDFWTQFDPKFSKHLTDLKHKRKVSLAQKILHIIWQPSPTHT